MRYKTADIWTSAVWTILFLFMVYFIEATIKNARSILSPAANGGKCYKDDTIGDLDGNVYFCNADGLTRCCTENNDRTCCVELKDKNIKEQLQLWGIVAGMIVLIAILFICCKNDISFCNGEMTLKERCSRCRNRGKNKKAHTIETEKPGQYFDNPAGDFEGPSNNNYYAEKEPYKFPPLPPVEELKSAKMYNQSYA